MNSTRNNHWKCGRCQCEYDSRKEAEECCICDDCKLFPADFNDADDQQCRFCRYSTGTEHEIQMAEANLKAARQSVIDATARLKQTKKDVARYEAWKRRFTE